MLKILIVEDEVISALTLEAFFQEEGFSVRLANSGQEALKQAAAFSPDILISDWKLKDEIDGIEVARNIEKMNPQLRTIFVSGMSVEDMKLKSEGIQVFRFMGKPCGLEEMLKAVKDAIAQS